MTYLGTVSAAFNALMRLSLRIHAERTDRDDALGRYLEDPRRLFIPARLLISTLTILAAALLARATGLDRAGFPLLVLSIVIVVLTCEHLIPLFIVRQDPERVLDVLLPSFDVIARMLKPLTYGLLRLGTSRRRQNLSGVRTDAHVPTVRPPVEVANRAAHAGFLDGVGAGGPGPRAAPQSRRLPRDDGARGHDAAPGHHRDRSTTPPSNSSTRCFASSSIHASQCSRRRSTTSMVSSSSRT